MDNTKKELPKRKRTVFLWSPPFRVWSCRSRPCSLHNVPGLRDFRGSSVTLDFVLEHCGRNHRKWCLAPCARVRSCAVCASRGRVLVECLAECLCSCASVRSCACRELPCAVVDLAVMGALLTLAPFSARAISLSQRNGAGKFPL